MPATLTATGITFSNTTVTNTDLIPAGTLICRASTTVPAGFFYCNGQAVSRTTYSVLFGRIGTSFGAGDGTTTFNVPDLRGEFLRGWDDARGVDSGRAIRTFQGGQNLSHGHNVSGFNANHTHSGNTGGASSNHSHQYQRPNDGNRPVQSSTGTCNQGDFVDNTSGESNGHSHGFGTGGFNANHFHGLNSSNNSGTVPRPRNWSLAYFIKF